MQCGNETGPAGMGPMTGRAAGYCAGNGAAGPMNAAGGRGRGSRGRHGGRGRGNRFRASGLAGRHQAAMGQAVSDTPEPVDPTVTKEQELDALKGQAQHLQDALEGINERIEELESKASGETEK